MVETTESRYANVTRIAAALHETQVGCEPFAKPDDPRTAGYGWPGGHPFSMHNSEAAALYDAGLRSTSRDSEVREAIEALPTWYPTNEYGGATETVERAAVLAILDRSAFAASASEAAATDADDAEAEAKFLKPIK